MCRDHEIWDFPWLGFAKLYLLGTFFRIVIDSILSYHFFLWGAVEGEEGFRLCSLHDCKTQEAVVNAAAAADDDDDDDDDFDYVFVFDYDYDHDTSS